MNGIAYFEKLVDERRATQSEWRMLRHLQRRLARVDSQPPVLQAFVRCSLALEAQQAALAAAFARALRETASKRATSVSLTWRGP